MKEPSRALIRNNDQIDDKESLPPVNDQHPNKSKKKGMDLDGLSNDAKALLLNFAIYLESESLDCSQFFESVKYEQMVKTKKKQSSVDIVPAEDFFRLIEDVYEIVSDINITEKKLKQNYKNFYD